MRTFTVIVFAGLFSGCCTLSGPCAGNVPCAPTPYAPAAAACAPTPCAPDLFGGYGNCVDASCGCRASGPIRCLLRATASLLNPATWCCGHASCCYQPTMYAPCEYAMPAYVDGGFVDGQIIEGGYVESYGMSGQVVGSPCHACGETHSSYTVPSNYPPPAPYGAPESYEVPYEQHYGAPSEPSPVPPANGGSSNPAKPADAHGSASMPPQPVRRLTPVPSGTMTAPRTLVVPSSL